MAQKKVYKLKAGQGIRLLKWIEVDGKILHEGSVLMVVEPEVEFDGKCVLVKQLRATPTDPCPTFAIYAHDLYDQKKVYEVLKCTYNDNSE